MCGCDDIVVDVRRRRRRSHYFMNALLRIKRGTTLQFTREITPLPNKRTPPIPARHIPMLYLMSITDFT